MSKIEESLSNLFQKHRIILWYDESRSLTGEFEALSLPGVEKITVQNNEFEVKHLIYRQKPAYRFLLYLPCQRPHNDDNWLLDVELSNYLYHTDKEAMVLQELELPITLRRWIHPHLEFFHSNQRKSKFLEYIKASDAESVLSLKMIQVVSGASSHDLEELITSYAIHFARGSSEAVDKELDKYNLTAFFWQEVETYYAYNSAAPGIYDFLLDVFQKGFSPTTGKAKVNHNAAILLSKWKDLKSFEGTLQELTSRAAEDLNIEQAISSLPLNELAHEDVFECVDRRIIRELVHMILHQVQNTSTIEQIIKGREMTFWWPTYRPFYKALEYALWLSDEVQEQGKITIADYQEGFAKYTSSWYLIDQYYRRFIEYYRLINQNAVLSQLFERVHKIYSNSWLPQLSQAWQQVTDNSGEWYRGSLSQSRFFDRDVKSRFLEKSIKVFVVISDGFRYECGRELNDMLNQQIRFSSTLKYQVTNLPSYTQLGMASLLPHKELCFGEGDTILADGKSTQGLQNRLKILQQHSGVRATAIPAENLMKMKARGPEAQELIQQHDLVYVYHNRIDKLGDDKTTEDKVFEASRDEIEFLMEVLKKIANMNGTYMIITSDHGFIYQHEDLLESDFTDAQIQGEVIHDSRRYVIGRNLIHNKNVVRYTARELNLQSDREVLLPKGIARLRKQGSGSRYVHGGMSLQETVVPVLFVAKQREDKTAKVEIDILNKTSNKITTNIHTVRFYQMQPVGAQYIARSVKAYFAIFSEEQDQKQVISDVFTYTFDLTSERTQDREVQKKFTISSGVRRSTGVYLVLEEKVEKTNKWITIYQFPYNLSLAIDNDFDEF
ncbi:MAG TPA: BREX-1 system phosphatase PglZ type A [Chitinophagales bacterium]|nr:BREX-1 system phosphatase PglZ type A [Chitinophagales bacterium]